MLTLAIESSCDETAVAIYGQHGTDPTNRLHASLISSQIALHRPHGGVVPELASRNHASNIAPLVTEALAAAKLALTDIDLFAATIGPGLSSALLIGATFAKTLALAEKKPFLGVNHLEGHLLSPFLEQDPPQEIPTDPFLALIVSGGHTLLIHVKSLGTYELLGTTRDDAAGEAFDKVGKMLGLPYPGGPEIEKVAKGGNPKAYDFPRALLQGMKSKPAEVTLDFSFSGLKTAVLYTLSDLNPDTGTPTDAQLPDLCASLQEAITDVLVRKTLHAARRHDLSLITISGGVSCNQYLTKAFQTATQESGHRFLSCPRTHSTDNAAMIAFAAHHRHQQNGAQSPLTEAINPNLKLAK